MIVETYGTTAFKAFEFASGVDNYLFKTIFQNGAVMTNKARFKFVFTFDKADTSTGEVKFKVSGAISNAGDNIAPTMTAEVVANIPVTGGLNIFESEFTDILEFDGSDISSSSVIFLKINRESDDSWPWGVRLMSIIVELNK